MRRPWILVAIGSLVLALSTAGFLLTREGGGEIDDAASVQSDPIREQLALLEAAGFSQSELLLDSDGDGLPDVLENYVYGSDPHAWSTTGQGIPDGWLAAHGFDPTTPGLAFRKAATPDPADVPAAYSGTWQLGWTLEDVYSWGRPGDWSEADDGPWENGIDPRKVSYAANGIPYAWLHHHGFAPEDAIATLAGVRPTSDDLTVLEKYTHNLDPDSVDTDGDGLADSQEIRVYATDPRRFSSSGTGIPDGWLVLHGLDPRDPLIGAREPKGKGMSVLEAWQFNLQRFDLQAALSGKGLAPTATSTLGHGVPDGWLVEHGFDPLDPSVPDKLVQRASDWSEARNLTESPAGLDPIPDMRITVRDAYTHGRPIAWEEATHGVWWRTLDPSREDHDGDGIPDVVEIRGWYIHVTTGVGPDAEGEWRRVTSDPLLEDTDGDGLTDGQEYFGRVDLAEHSVLFSPTDPRNRDTAFSGLTDGEKVLSLEQWTSIDGPGDGTFVKPVLNPAMRDTGGSYLGDGKEHAFWLAYGNAFDAEAACPAWIASLGATSNDELRKLLGPWGDVDGDGLANIVDADADQDGLPNGWEIQPSLYRHSQFAQKPARSATDPANGDTDCDGLRDGWEVKHGVSSNGKWTLDPAKKDSDDNGIPDGKENPDQDTVIWYLYREGQRFEQKFEYNNLVEQDQKTDPNDRDENRDGVSEGWVYFWGHVYPEWITDSLQGCSDKVGCHYPSKAQLGELKGRFSNPLNEVGGQVKDLGETKGVTPYRRAIEDAQDITPFLNAKGNEKVDGGATNTDGKNPGKTNVVRDSQIVNLWRGVLHGEYRLTHAEDQKLRLNPYLSDTDDDGIPDTWEALYGGAQGILGACVGVDAARPDAGNDAGSGRSNEAVYLNPPPGGYWSHPCQKDTDLDGVPDTIEVGLGMDPTDPFDVTFAFGQDDSDDDGIPDATELERGTDPLHPDSDHDGLLDGKSIDLTIGQQDALIQRWRALGIANKVNDNKVTFYGEETFGRVATNANSRLAGVPDGWLDYYSQFGDLSAKQDTLRAAYTCNRPAWWDESRMGVWWWGRAPTTGLCLVDMDRDGLLDKNGEDPTPAGRDGPGDTHPLDAIKAGTTRLEILEAAQTWTACAGNPLNCQKQWQEDDPASFQAPVGFRNIEWPSAISKREDFTVSGRLCLDDGEASCTPIPRRTVTVEIGEPESSTQSLGIGFTDQQGRFTVQACVCPDREIAIPVEGMVAHGRQTGLVKWTVPADEIPVGESTLALRAYATTPMTPPEHPHALTLGTGYTATGRATLTNTLPLQSATQLALKAPTVLAWASSRTLHVDVLLEDAAGGRLEEAITVELVLVGSTQGLLRSADTGVDGKATVSFTNLGSNRIGQYEIRAAFAKTSLLSATSAAADITLQAPSTLTLGEIAGPTRTGQPLSVTASATSLAQAIADAFVEFTLRGEKISATTDAEGIATVNFNTDDMQAGTYQLTATLTAKPELAGHQASASIAIVSGSQLDAVFPDKAPRGGTIEVSGHLRVPDGSGLANRPLKLVVGTHEVSTLSTEADGTFSASVILPKAMGAGLWQMTISYEGEDEAIDGSQQDGQLRIVIPSRLTLHDAVAARDQTIELEGRIVDADGRGLRGQPVVLQTGAGVIERVVSRSDGRFSAQWTVPKDVPHGPQNVKAVYEGSANGTYAPTIADAQLLIHTTTILNVTAPGDVGRGTITIVGSLRSEDGGIPDAPVSVRIGNHSSAMTNTGPDGAYEHKLSLATLAPGPFTVETHFDGNDTYAPASSSGAGVLVVQPRLAISPPGDIARGKAAAFTASLLDDRGRPVEGATITFDVLNKAIDATTDASGVATATSNIAPDAELGVIPVQARFLGSPGLKAASASADATVKEGAVLVIEPLPHRARPHEPITITVRLTDLNDQPMSGHKVGVRFDGDPLATIATTDKNGVANITLSVPPLGATRIAAFFAGDANYAPTRADSGIIELTTGRPSSAWRQGTSLATLGAAAMGIAAVTAGGITWARVRRNPPLLNALQRADQAIAAGRDWKAAVQQAYRDLVEETAFHGHDESSTETVREFMQSLASVAPIPPSAAIELTRLFENATYSTGDTAFEDAGTARSSLQRIIRAIQTHLGIEQGETA